MQIKCVKTENVKTYYLDGELDTITSKQLSDQIDTSSCDKIIFDLEKLNYISCENNNITELDLKNCGKLLPSNRSTLAPQKDNIKMNY